MLSVLCVEQVFTIRTGIIPGLVERQNFVGNGNLTQPVLSLAFDYVEILLIQMDMFFFRSRNSEIRVPLYSSMRTIW